jgi:hydroxylamine reductase (hybrid-cluster protein)
MSIFKGSEIKVTSISNAFSLSLFSLDIPTITMTTQNNEDTLDNAIRRLHINDDEEEGAHHTHDEEKLHFMMQNTTIEDDSESEEEDNEYIPSDEEKTKRKG